MRLQVTWADRKVVLHDPRADGSDALLVRRWTDAAVAMLMADTQQDSTLSSLVERAEPDDEPEPDIDPDDTRVIGFRPNRKVQ